MDKHKQTPDILAEILGGEAASAVEPAASARPRPTAKSRPATPAKRAAPVERKVQGAQKWEYRLVSFHNHSGWRPRFIDGKELDDWMHQPLIHEYIHQLGEEGWELIAASSGERIYGLGDKHQLYFKRQR